MAQQTLNNLDSRTTIRGKINDNFTELYSGGSGWPLTGTATLTGKVSIFGDPVNDVYFGDYENWDTSKFIKGFGVVTNDYIDFYTENSVDNTIWAGLYLSTGVTGFLSLGTSGLGTVSASILNVAGITALNLNTPSLQLNGVAASSPTTEFLRGDGTWAVPAGGGGGGGVQTLDVDTTQVGNGAPGEWDLYTYTLPANTLTADGQALKIRVAGTFGSNSNFKQLKVRFGLNFIATVNVQSQGYWTIDCDLVRTGASSQAIRTMLVGDSGFTQSYGGNGTMDFTSDITIRVTGQSPGSVSNDIVKEMVIIRLFPEP